MVPKVIDRLVADALASPTVALGRWSAWGGPAALFAPGGVSAQGGAVVGGGYRVLPWLLCGLEAFVPLLFGEASDTRGQASVGLFALRAVTQVEPWADRRFSAALGLAVGGAAVRASGKAMVEQAQVQTDWTMAATVALRAQIAAKIGPAARILGIVSTGVALPEVHVNFGPDVVAAMGRPLIDVLVAVQWAWGDPP